MSVLIACAVILVCLVVFYYFDVLGVGGGLGVFPPSTAHLKGRYLVRPDGQRYFLDDGGDVVYWVSPSCKGDGSDPISVSDGVIGRYKGGGDIRKGPLAAMC